jgi:hypothetical protein
MNRKGRLTARLNDRGGQNVEGLGMAIDLNYPPTLTSIKESMARNPS